MNLCVINGRNIFKLVIVINLWKEWLLHSASYEELWVKFYEMWVCMKVNYVSHFAWVYNMSFSTTFSTAIVMTVFWIWQLKWHNFMYFFFVKGGLPAFLSYPLNSIGFAALLYGAMINIIFWYSRFLRYFSRETV